MKEIGTIIFMVFFCLSLSAQHKFVISGTIPHQYKGVDIILSSESSAFNSISTKEKNGKFYITGQIRQGYEPAYLSVRKNNIYLGGFFLFIGSQDMKIDIVKLNEKDALNVFHFSNVPFVEEQKEYDRLTKTISDSIKFAFKPYDDVRLGYVKGPNKDSLWTIVSDLRKKLLIQKIKFIDSFPNAYISLYLFNKDIINSIHPITADRLKTIYDKFGNNLKVTNLGQSVEKYIKKKLSLTVGNVLPNFSFSTDKGEHFELSSFLSAKKFVLLCFWGSGCAPCIKKIPELKIINEKYEAKGLQLISISLDNSIDSWLNSLKRYEMPWVQTCDLSAYTQGDKIAKALDVNRMPQYFLMDNAGVLVYHNEQLNDDDEFTILQKLLESQLP